MTEIEHDPRLRGAGLVDMGMAAARRGEPIEANPMRPGSRAWLAWRVGWSSVKPGNHRDG